MRARYPQWIRGVGFCVVVGLSACGHSIQNAGGDAANLSNENNQSASAEAVSLPPGLTAKQQYQYNLIGTDNYGGELTVIFQSPKTTEEAIKAVPGFAMSRSVRRTFAEEQERHAAMEKKFKKKFLDWNRVYHAEAKDKAKARQLFVDLVKRADVRLAYPKQRERHPSLGSTPSLQEYQTYLNPAVEGGLNIRAAWGDGVYGAGAIAVITDGGFDLQHEQFDIDERRIDSGGNLDDAVCTPEASHFGPDYLCGPEGVAHGTATLGILHARHGLMGGRGIGGIAPDAFPWIGVGDALELPHGSVVVLECAVREAYVGDETVTCADGHNGFACIPCSEGGPESYALIREAVLTRDVTFVSTSGNGAINLDETPFLTDDEFELVCGGPRSDPSAADCWESNGALLVGANQGDRGMVSGQVHKASWSNCGEKVQVNAWGERVVTTTWFEDAPIPGYAWDAMGGGSDPPNDDPNSAYTNQFGGTSAATAIVGGAATLVQSYFKDISNGTPAGDGSVAAARYLTPAKLKEILVQSGTQAYTDDGCSVGVQPDVAEAFELVRGFWNTTRTLYPELAGGGSLTVAKREALHNLGVGMVCEGNVEDWDPACPSVVDILVCDRENSATNPAECISYDVLPHLAKEMDFDEDGRGDLVQYVNGSWKIDLSSRGSGTDHLGGWDLTITTPRLSKGIPVAADYNSDGKTDLAVYNRADGKFYIAFTDDQLFAGRTNVSWDLIVDWPGTADRDTYTDTFYTRPLPADYNGDGWLDLGVTTSDGHWKMSFGWRTASDAAWQQRRYRDFGPLKPDYADSQWKQDITFLTAEELAAYPGWAYVPVVAKNGGCSIIGNGIVSRGPNGMIRASDANGRIWPDADTSAAGFENIFMINGFYLRECDNDYGIKTISGDWQWFKYPDWETKGTEGVFGSWQCKPASYDMDGDGYDEAIVYCPSEVRVLFSVSGEFRHIPLGYTNSAMLPGRPIFGGLNYDRVLQVRSKMKELKMTTIPPLFDYLITPYEYCNLPWSRGEFPEECR